jgi:hypothetical protein
LFDGAIKTPGFLEDFTFQVLSLHSNCLIKGKLIAKKHGHLKDWRPLSSLWQAFLEKWAISMQVSYHPKAISIKKIIPLRVSIRTKALR